jgi:hypothetical protein
MPSSRNVRVVKSKYEKSAKEQQCQETKRLDGLLSKAHQLVVKCDANVAMFVRYPRTGRIHIYQSTKEWPPPLDLDVGITLTVSPS